MPLSRVACMPDEIPRPAASTPDQFNALLLEKTADYAHGVGAAADTGIDP